MKIIASRYDVKEGDWESIEDFRKENPKWKITEIDNKGISGFCEGCEKPLFDDMSHYITADEVYLCHDCYCGLMMEDGE